MENVIAFSRYYTALAFGMMVAARFVGMPSSRKNYLALWTPIPLPYFLFRLHVCFSLAWI